MSWMYQSKPAMIWAAIRHPTRVLGIWWTNRYFGVRQPLRALKEILAVNEAWGRKFAMDETVRIIDGVSASEIGRLTFMEDLIVVNGMKLKPIMVIEAAFRWIGLSVKRGWLLKDQRGLKINFLAHLETLGEIVEVAKRSLQLKKTP